jgi:MFS family permease
VFRRHWRRLIVGTFVCVATYVVFYLLTTFTLAYGTAPSTPRPGAKVGLGFERSTFLSLMLAAVVFLAVAIIVAGALADRVGRRRLLLAVTTGLLGFGLLLQIWFGSPANAFGVFSFLVVGFILMGLSYGPMGALLTELFPTEVRYTGSALVYNLGSIVGASFAPTIALAVWRADGDITWVGVYLAVAAVVSFVALLFVPETRSSSLQAVRTSEA